MKRKLHFKSLLVLVALLLGVSSAWANERTSTLNFTKACGGSGTADDGIKWTVTSDGAESNFDSNSGIHYGTGGKAVTYLTLTSEAFGSNCTITKVVVNARDAQATAAVTVTIGGTAFGTAATATNSSTDYTFEGTAKGGVIEVKVDRGSSMVKAIYVKSIVVTYDDGINLTDPTISFPEKSYTATVGEPFTAPTPSCDSNGEKSYTSSNKEVATVDNDGKVTIVGVGTTTITLNVAETSTYSFGSASYTLTVEEKAGEIQDGYYDFAINQDYGSNIKPSSVTVQEGTWTAGNVVMNASGRNCWYEGKTFRLYKKNSDGGAGTIVFTVPEGKVITKIVFDGSGLAGLTASSNTFNSENGTWEGTEESVSFTAKDNASTITIKTIAVTYGNPPSVQAPLSSVLTGTYLEAQSVKLTCETEGAEIYYTTNGDTPTNASTKYEKAIMVSKTTTIKAIAYNGGGASKVTEITIIIPGETYENIAKLKEAKPSAPAILNLNEAQVMLNAGNDLYVADASGAIDFFKTGLTYATGTKLNGKIVVTYGEFKNLPEITKIGENQLTTADGEPKATEVATDGLSASDYCKLVKVTGTITNDGSDVKVGDLVVYQKFSSLISETVLKGLTTGDNVTITGIVLPFNDGLELGATAIDVNITLSKDMVAFCFNNKLDYSNSGLTVYTAKVKNGAAQLMEIENAIINKGTGVILSGTAGQTYTVPVTKENVSATSGNELKGVIEDTAIEYTADGKFNYILQNGTFKKATGDKLKAGKAYLNTNYDVNASADGARELKIVVEGEATAIKAIETAADKNVYDLQGRKVAAPTKGLYIVNGKKMIVK